jgi:hypothetical protein
MDNNFMQSANGISRLYLGFSLGAVAAPLLFGTFDAVYVLLTHHRALAFQVDPLVVRVLGTYNALFWPLPLYFLISVIGGVLGLAFGAYQSLNSLKQT